MEKRESEEKTPLQSTSHHRKIKFILKKDGEESVRKKFHYNQQKKIKF